MPAPDDETRPDAETPARESPATAIDREPASSQSRAYPAVRGSIWLLEHTQDIVTITIGIILIVLAAVVLISAIVDFVNGTYGPISKGAPKLLDQVLLVLILVEIVHTVVLSLRSHRLVAQPFIVVGLIASSGGFSLR